MYGYNAEPPIAVPIYTVLPYCVMYVGQLVAWALSDKEDADTLECLWAVIKRRCPSATVMTDDGKHFWAIATFM